MQLSPHSHCCQLLSSGRRLQHEPDNDFASELPIFRDAAAVRAVVWQEAPAACNVLKTREDTTVATLMPVMGLL